MALDASTAHAKANKTHIKTAFNEVIEAIVEAGLSGGLGGRRLTDTQFLRKMELHRVAVTRRCDAEPLGLLMR